MLDKSYNLQGHEFDYYIFEQLPEINTQTKNMKEHIVYAMDEAIPGKDEVHLSIKDEEIKKL